MKARLEMGEISCIALRLYRADGSSEDEIGGTDDEKAEALASLRRGFEQAH